MSKYTDGINEVNMDKFLAALRSGDYRQGKRKLNHIDANGNENLCCMGVMSELAHEDGAVTREVTTYVDAVLYDGNGLLPSKKVLEWLGIPETDHIFVINNEYNIMLRDTGLESSVYMDYVTPSELNDSRDMNFNQIADAFEKAFTRKD